MGKGIIAVAALVNSLLQDPASAAQGARQPADTEGLTSRLAGVTLPGSEIKSEFLRLESKSLTNQAVLPQLQVLSATTEAAKSNIAGIYASSGIDRLESLGYQRCIDIDSLAAHEQSIRSLERFVGTDLLRLSRRMAELQLSAACGFSGIEPDARSLAIVQHSLSLDFGVEVAGALAGSNTFKMPASWSLPSPLNRPAVQRSLIAARTGTSNPAWSPGEARFLKLKSAEIPTSEEIVCDGSPKVGRAKIIYNMHGNEDSRDVVRDYEVLSQRETWRQLERENCKHLFAEGLARTLAPGDAGREPLLLPGEARLRFPNGFQEELSDGQSDFLHWFGAARLYAALHPDVTLHRTMTVEERDFLQNRPPPTPQNYDEWKEVTQRYAMRELAEFFERMPGERAVVVFGSAHHFKPDDFPRHSRIPAVSAARFSELEKICPIEVSGRLIHVRDPERQLALIRDAHTVLPFAFPTLWSEAGQLEALPKLSRQDISTDALRRFLHEGSVSSDVAAKVDEYFRAKAGPFREYRVPESW